jgi:hypothetical protein
MFHTGYSSGAKSEVDSKMSRAQSVCHALCGIRSAARADTFHQQGTVSDNQSKKGRGAIDPEAGREIPRGSDEESNTERSSVERDESAKQSTSPPQRPDADGPHGK